MEVQIFNVRDSRVAGYNHVFFASSEAEAMRHYMVLLVQKDTPFGMTPGDFILDHFGSFDTETGKFTTFEQPKQVCTFSEIEIMISRYETQRRNLAEGGKLLGGATPHKTSEADKESDSEPISNKE